MLDFLDVILGFPGLPAASLGFPGLPQATPLCGDGHTPSKHDFKKVFNEVATGTAPHKGVQGVGGRKKITKMVYCLYEGKTEMDREFMRAASMCTHRRDERAGRLALRCAAVTSKLDQRRFHMSVQTGMGTGATNITKATDKAWVEFSTRYFNAPLVRSKIETEFDKNLYNHIRNTHRQLIIDSASDERLSGRQMEEAMPFSSCIHCHALCEQRLRVALAVLLNGHVQ